MVAGTRNFLVTVIDCQSRSPICLFEVRDVVSIPCLGLETSLEELVVALGFGLMLCLEVSPLQVNSHNNHTLLETYQLNH